MRGGRIEVHVREVLLPMPEPDGHTALSGWSVLLPAVPRSVRLPGEWRVRAQGLKPDIFLLFLTPGRQSVKEWQMQIPRLRF